MEKQKEQPEWFKLGQFEVFDQDLVDKVNEIQGGNLVKANKYHELLIQKNRERLMQELQKNFIDLYGKGKFIIEADEGIKVTPYINTKSASTRSFYTVKKGSDLLLKGANQNALKQLAVKLGLFNSVNQKVDAVVSKLETSGYEVTIE